MPTQVIIAANPEKVESFVEYLIDAYNEYDPSHPLTHVDIFMAIP